MSAKVSKEHSKEHSKENKANTRGPASAGRRLYVGVDVAQADLAVAIAWGEAPAEYWGKQPNTVAGCAALVAQVQRQQTACGAETVHLIVEPTGKMEAEVVDAAYQAGWLVTLVNLNRTCNWRAAQGRRAKTDRQDALLLAQYGADEQPEPQQQLAAELEELESLLNRRQDLEKLLRSERNRLGQLPRRSAPTVRQSLARSIKALEQELDTIEAAIRQLQQAHHCLRLQLRQLLSIPGVGVKIAPFLLVWLSRFLAKTNGRGTAKQFVAFLGLDPKPHQSGKSHRRSTISRQGNATLRSLLFFGALGGVRGRNPLAAFYTSLLAHNKPKKLALVACARKIATWAWAVLAHNSFFDPAYAANH
jgi:transposase